MSFKLNHTSYVHKRIRDNVKLLEKITNSNCKNLDATFSGFLLFVSKDKKCCFIITIEEQFYFISFTKFNDNLYYIIENNMPLVNSVLEDLHWLNTMHKFD